MKPVARICLLKPAMLALVLMFAPVVWAEAPPAAASGQDEVSGTMQTDVQPEQAPDLAIDQAGAGDEDQVYKLTVPLPQQKVYGAVYDSLEKARFYVVFEPNIGQNLAGLADRWGDDYNKNALTAIRSMVFCNAWYANRVSNVDPDMLGTCPLHLTMIERKPGGKAVTTILFNRPSVIAANSPARPVFEQIEKEVTGAIKAGVASARNRQKKDAE
jgi:hypothetical protein